MIDVIVVCATKQSLIDDFLQRIREKLPPLGEKVVAFVMNKRRYAQRRNLRFFIEQLSVTSELQQQVVCIVSLFPYQETGQQEHKRQQQLLKEICIANTYYYFTNIFLYDTWNFLNIQGTADLAGSKFGSFSQFYEDDETLFTVNRWIRDDDDDDDDDEQGGGGGEEVVEEKACCSFWFPFSFCCCH